MTVSPFSQLTTIGVYLLATAAWPVPFACRAAAAPAVPAVFQDLYNGLQGDLNTFNNTLNSQWNGVKYPVLFTPNLWNANANSGPLLPTSGSVAAIQVQLQELKAMGAEGVTVAVGFPMLYEPFFSSQDQYQQFVSFYQNVAASVRALGMKLIIDNECLRNGQVLSGWDTATFYASLTWDEYQAARAQTAVTIAQTMQPDYMVVLEEPDTEAMMTGQSAINTVSGSASMLGQIMTSIQQAGITGTKFGAGVGSWLPQYQQFIQSFVTFPVDFIDMHVLPVNLKFLPNALTIANIAASAGKPVAMSQAWLRKARDNELTVLTPDQLLARDPFDFWAPLDTYYLQTMQTLSYYTKMCFMSPVESIFFWAYLPYNDVTSLLDPTDIMNQAVQQSGQNMMAGTFTSTGVNFYQAILPSPDSVPPGTPANLTAASGQPTQAYLTWTASADNVGVAGYNVLRNGVIVGTTAQTSYTDTGLTTATTYSYSVQAYDLAGNLSPLSAVVPVTTWSTIPPSVPRNVVATAASCQKITLAWSAAADKIGIKYYRIFRGTSSADFAQIDTTYGTTTTYTSYPMAPATRYYFAVQAMDSDGNVSAMSTIVSATTPTLPSPPAQVTGTALTTSAISLTWTPGRAGMGVGGYYIFRGPSPAKLSQIGTQGPSTSFGDNQLNPQTTYYYAVKEIDEGGNVSPMSAPTAVTTLALPSPPGTVTAIAIGKTAISITWTPAQSGMPLSVYRIFQGVSPAPLVQFGTVGPTTLSLTIYTATPGTTYYYGVEAVDNGGNVSPMSALASVTTPQ